MSIYDIPNLFVIVINIFISLHDFLSTNKIYNVVFKESQYRYDIIFHSASKWHNSISPFYTFTFRKNYT